MKRNVLRRSQESDKFTRRVRRVVDRGNCSGCGGCALLSRRVSMEVDDRSGFLQPKVDSSAAFDPHEEFFDRVCPGVSLRPPQDARPSRHPELGGYHAAWRAWAMDDEIRHAGSSGGVLTAISAWLVETHVVGAVAAAQQDVRRPTHTAAVSAVTTDEIRSTAGSRYAPVENLTTWGGRADVALVGKPCEISAVRRLNTELGVESSTPLLSFFCAGTPSQHATDRLVEKLGSKTELVESLRYRGNGWPGDFEVTDTLGRRATMSYKESWGGNLGRQLQWRCKTCVDGTGGDADLAVGDFWKVDADGYPDFSDGAGQSVLIARTARGLSLALRAQEAGVVEMHPIDLDQAARVQPLQVQRRRLLLGRMLGRAIAGKPAPRYWGFGLWRLAMQRPLATLRAAAGTLRRSVTER